MSTADLHPDLYAAIDRVAERMMDKIAEGLWRSTMTTPSQIPDEVLRAIVGGSLYPREPSYTDLASALLAAREALRFYGRANIWERKMRRAQVGELASWFNERHEPWVIVLNEWEQDNGKKARALLPEEGK